MYKQRTIPFLRLFVASLLLILSLCTISFGMSVSAQEIAPRDCETLQSHGIYTVSYADDYAPFSYTDTQGNATGMAINIMEYMAQVADFQVKYVTVEDAKQKGIPVDINLGILQADQLPNVNRLSVAYTSFQMMAVSNTETVDPNGSAVGYLPYDHLSKDSVKAALPGCTPYTYPSYTEMSQEFIDGHLDYMLVTSLIANQMLETTFEDDTYIVPTTAHLDVHLSYSGTMNSDEIAAFQRLIVSLDSNHVYNLMLNAVMASSNQTMDLLTILQTYGGLITLVVLGVFAVIATVIIRVNYVKQKALEYIINVDELTGAMTERKFHHTVGQAFASGTSGKFFILSIDINNFKTINENFGYDIGSQTIAVFGNMLQSIFPTSPVARCFADHFVILYQADAEHLEIPNDTVFSQLVSRATSNLLGESYPLTTSTGIYPVDNFTRSISYMIDCASLARREGKNSYDNSKTFFTKTMEQSIHQKNDIVLSMESAMDAGEFQVYYQPKINLKTGALAGAEALIRWICPTGQLRFPDQFIPLFESNGFIVKLDYFVLQEVCAFLTSHPDLVKIAINISGMTMLDGTLVSHIEEALQQHQIDAHRLEIEITESAVVHNFDVILSQITQLKQLGVTISMDDFGAGISSLNRLSLMDFDVLKIDKVFLAEQTPSPKSLAILNHIIAMAHELNITTVAEGVEYPEQASLLKSLGCDMTQGYYYARPMNQAEYLKFVANYKTQ